MSDEHGTIEERYTCPGAACVCQILAAERERVIAAAVRILTRMIDDANRHGGFCQVRITPEGLATYLRAEIVAPLDQPGPSTATVRAIVERMAIHLRDNATDDNESHLLMGELVDAFGAYKERPGFPRPL